MKSTKEINKKVVSHIKRYSIEPASRIIVAWSGGPDSTALLDVLANLEEYDFSITAAWYNHGLRPETELINEEKLVVEQARKMGVELVRGYARTGEIKEKAEKLSLSLEEAARNERYKFLFKVLNDKKARYIAVGHNLDDNTETMLMRFLRNEGVQGLSGIPEIRDVLIRPLSRVKRSDINEYIVSRELPVSTDGTNLEKDFLRNRLRHDVIPAIRKVFPEADENLRNFSDKIKLYNDYLGMEVQKKIEWETAPSFRGFRLQADIFYSNHILLRILAVFNVLNRLEVKTRIRYNAVKNAVEGAFPGNGKMLLGTTDFEILTSNGYIFVRRLVNHNKKSYFIYLDWGSLVYFAGQTVIAVLDNGNHHAVGENTVEVPWGHGCRLVVRSYREGDSIGTGEGRKSIKKLFNEWKVSSFDRERLPLIEISGSIIAVAGRHLGYENRTGRCEITSGLDSKILLYFNSDTEKTCE